jgi:hypothetical protein
VKSTTHAKLKRLKDKSGRSFKVLVSREDGLKKRVNHPQRYKSKTLSRDDRKVSVLVHAYEYATDICLGVSAILGQMAEQHSQPTSVYLEVHSPCTRTSDNRLNL